MANGFDEAASPSGGIAARLVESLVLLSLASPAVAIPSPQPVFVVSSTVGACTLSVESDPEWRTLRLRVHDPDDRDCAIDKDSMLSLLRSALAKTDPPVPDGGYKTVYIGRLVDYPWLSSYLAVTAFRDPAWDSKKGKPVAVDLNRYVDDLLSRDELTLQLRPAFVEAGYAVVGMTVEKVLVGAVHDVPGRVPFDAQVWFRIEKR